MKAWIVSVLCVAAACGDAEIKVTDVARADAPNATGAGENAAPKAAPLQAGATLDKGDGCTVEIVAPGTGRAVVLGDDVWIRYAVSVKDADRPVASTLGWIEPLRVRLVPHELTNPLRGIARAVDGLPIGTRATIELPPALAYGAAGLPSAGIPPDSTLRIEVELVGAN